MRRQRTMLAVIIAIACAGCSSGLPLPSAATPTPRSTLAPHADALTGPGDPEASPESSPAAPADAAALLGSRETLEIPEDPAAAATYLAAAVMDPATSRAATREILLRSGVPIYRADTGEPAAAASSPAYVDAYLYDFNVPLLADSVANGATVSLTPLVELLVAAGWAPQGTSERDLEPWLAAWMDASVADPGGDLSFGGLAVEALMKVQADRGSAASGTAAPAASPGATASSGGTGTPGPMRLDPIAFQIVLSSTLSDLGTIEAPTAGAGAVRLASAVSRSPATQTLAGPVCNEPAKKYDSGIGDWIFKKWLGKTGASYFGGAFGTAMKPVSYAKILGTIQARDALMAGMTLKVQSEGRGPHYRHSDHDGVPGDNLWDFVATADFHTDVAGMIVSCGPLAGLRIPENGGIKGLRLQWDLSANLLCFSEAGNDCQKLGRIGSGGGGDTTDGDGKSRLKVEPVGEPGCPTRDRYMQSDARCKHGKIETKDAWASVTVDLTTTPPLKLADLIFKFDGLGLVEDTAKALAKVLIDVATDIATSLNSAKGYQQVQRHVANDYKVRYSSDGITISGVKCGGYEGEWTLKMSGGFEWIKATGSLTFTLDGDAKGKGAVDFNIGGTLKQGSMKFSTNVQAKGTMDVALPDPENATVLKLSNFKGGVKAQGIAPSVRLDKFFTGEGGSGGYPVETGSFCKE